MNTLFTVITPTARPHLLPCLSASFNQLVIPPGIQLQWVVNFHNPYELRTESELILRLNRLIDTIPGGFFCHVSDDSLLHPELLVEWSRTEATGICLFHQRLLDGTVRPATYEILHAGGPLDMGQAIIARSAVNGPFFSLGWERYMFKHIADIHGVEFIDRVLSYHDALHSV